YDGLVELFDKKSLPAAGFAMGLERLLLLIQTINGDIKFNKAPDIVVTSEDTGSSHVIISNILRNEFPELKIIADCSKSRIKKQHENAVGSGCKYIITLQKDDMMNLWDLEKHKRFSLTIGDVISYIKKFLFI
ncbi:histidine--tRNA ligase, partial [Salmonella enterica]|nr:histidine--tRNA ligase [Salmonella enterica]